MSRIEATVKCLQRIRSFRKALQARLFSRFSNSRHASRLPFLGRQIIRWFSTATSCLPEMITATARYSSSGRDVRRIATNGGSYKVPLKRRVSMGVKLRSQGCSFFACTYKQIGPRFLWRCGTTGPTLTSKRSLSLCRRPTGSFHQLIRLLGRFRTTVPCAL